MFRKSRNGWIAAALTAVLLMLPLAPAEAAGGRSPAGPADLWSQLLGWLSAEILDFEWAEEGSGIDPNGRPHATTDGEAGSSIDPNG